MRVAIQPCGDSVAREHYVDTIKNLVPASAILPHLSEEQAAKFSVACGPAVAVWGVTPGKRGQNKTKWSRLRPGDVALLYGQKRIFSQGRITFLLHSSTLAKQLWGTTEDGQTWEYIYFLDELREVEVGVDQYNAALGYSPTNIVQGFQVHDGEQADALTFVLGIDPINDPVDSSSSPLTVAQAAIKLATLTATDTSVKGSSRQEAQIFREMLFGGRPSSVCDLCGRLLPSGLLVAAHKKPRANCNDAERRDASIVMRACRLGCDELYERSYLIVDAFGRVAAGEALTSATKELREFASTLIGRSCTAHSPESEKYFDWHRRHQTRRLKCSSV
jgi:hypothetical protein